MTSHSIPNRHTGGKFLTIERLNAREDEDRRLYERSSFVVYAEPAEDERLYTGKHSSACLTHITRNVATFHEGPTPDTPIHHRTPHSWCGTFPGGRWNYEWVPVDGEFFACHKCIDAAAHHGVDTFSLVPNTGCEATGGERYK